MTQPTTTDSLSNPPRFNERRSTLLLFAYGFGNAAAYVIARTVADSEFLSRVGPERLPNVYLASAGTVALTSAVYGLLVRGASVRRAVVMTLGLLSFLTAVLPLLVDAFPTAPLALTAVYLMAQVRGSLGTIQFTVLLNEQFAGRRPERVVGIVGIGSTLAGFLLGMALGQFSNSFNLASLLYVVALIDVATMIPVRLLPPGRRQQNSLPDEFFWLPSTEQNTWELNGTHYPLRLASMMAVAVVCTTLVEYQWKVTVAEQLQRDETQLAQYFGTFYGCVFLLTGLLQFFLTAAVLKHRGVIAGLLLFPLALFVSGIGVLLSTSGRMLLAAVSFAKGCDALKRSMNDPAVHLLYTPLPNQLRHQVVTMVAGIIKPIAEATASVVLIVMATTISSRQLSWIVLALIAAWLTLDVLVWQGFRRLRQHTEADEQRSE